MRTAIIATIIAALPTCVAAAELPRKTKTPSSEVKVAPCPSYGAGFVRIEGSRTCVKIGSTVRVEAAGSR